mmetsp:Transcript_11163/g.37201  ORF Transcript_11163/g.37201 Transcript_11163/m.37201 type:complete len:334 (-) Transcript_11163:30-1031(-)
MQLGCLACGEPYALRRASDVPPRTQSVANYTCVTAGAMLGTVVRYATSNGTVLLGMTDGADVFADAWSNALGSFIMGLLVGSNPWLSANAPAAYVGATAGFCGCLTTFSGWAADAAALFTRGRIAAGIAQLAVNVSLPCCALELGVFVASLLPAAPGGAMAENVTQAERDKAAEAALPIYHTFKLLAGVALVALEAAIALVVIFRLPARRVVALGALFSVPGATCRYALAQRNAGAPWPRYTLLVNVLATGVTTGIAALVRSGATRDSANARDVCAAVVLGFAGGLSTVSTLVNEFRNLRASNARLGYKYLGLTLVAGQCVAIPIMGLSRRFM